MSFELLHIPVSMEYPLSSRFLDALREMYGEAMPEPTDIVGRYSHYRYEVEYEGAEPSERFRRYVARVVERYGSSAPTHLQVVRLRAEGLSDSAIAMKLGISRGRVGVLLTYQLEVACLRRREKERQERLWLRWMDRCVNLYWSDVALYVREGRDITSLPQCGFVRSSFVRSELDRRGLMTAADFDESTSGKALKALSPEEILEGRISRHAEKLKVLKALRRREKVV